jgi:hypothetical protein
LYFNGLAQDKRSRGKRRELVQAGIVSSEFVSSGLAAEGS